MPLKEDNAILKPSVVAIIQARMRSTRLPGKAMLDLAGKPVLYHVIERTLTIEGVDKVVLATSTGEDNNPLIELAVSMNIDVFIGSIHDVLERYYFASERCCGNFIIRVTGDNPFTDPEYASLGLKIALETQTDLCSISNIPLGTAVEIIKKEALNKAYFSSDKNYHREHVTPFIKEHPGLFLIKRHYVAIDNPFSNLRLTVDTPEDYQLAKIIYENIYKGYPFPLQSVIDFLKENPDLVNINSKIKHRPMTHSGNGR